MQYCPPTPTHTPTHMQSQHEAWKATLEPENRNAGRAREMWKRELRGNQEDGGCLSMAMGTIHCRRVNCLPMMCAGARYIPSLCSETALEVCSELRPWQYMEIAGGAGDARRQTLRDGDFPVVIQEHEFSLIFVSFVFTVRFSGAAGWLPLHLPKWEPYSQTI